MKQYCRDRDEIRGVQLTGTAEWITDPAEMAQVQQMFALDCSKGFNHWDTLVP